MIIFPKPSAAVRLSQQAPGDTRRTELGAAFSAVRAHSLSLSAPLSPEDHCIQSMPDASPAKWHLAHTTWFFETMVLGPNLPDYPRFDDRYAYLFNSYYEALGPRHPRPQRGLLSRPALADVIAYRRHVEEHLLQFIQACNAEVFDAIEQLITLGLHHEQQHQELLLTDALHMLSCSPLLPAYDPACPALQKVQQSDWCTYPGGIASVGHAGPQFAFDNESPRHRVLLQPYALATALVSCGEYAEFIADGGYRRPDLWLSDGWALVQSAGWQHPLYWIAPGDPRAPAADWQTYGLSGLRALDRAEPVMNLSFFEAAAYAQWAGCRLPTEFEWEAAAGDRRMAALHGTAWQWTRSSYDPYPGYHPAPGAVGEYNGKFMVGQIVLRGSSHATPAAHARDTYRNFFPPHARWQFAGVRVARDV